MKEGELYSIECDVEIKTEPCERDYCWIHERCEFDYENNGSIKSCGVKKTAILKPSRQEPQEDELWDEVIKFIQNSGIGKMVFSIHKEALKAKFQITRR